MALKPMAWVYRSVTLSLCKEDKTLGKGETSAVIIVKGQRALKKTLAFSHCSSSWGRRSPGKN